MGGDEALLTENLKGLPKGGPADAEPLSERVLPGEPAAVGMNPGSDLVGQNVSDALMLVYLSRHV